MSRLPFWGGVVCLKPGDTVFDIGVAWGVMTSMFASMVSADGAGGKVHSFEANPGMRKYTDALLEANHFEQIVKWNNHLICDSSGSSSPFYVVDGYMAVASSANSCVKAKGAKEVQVSTLAIDDYCKRNAVCPDYIKIDIEGAEYVAVMGMKELIEDRHPTFQIETHGMEINDIGGDLLSLLRFLEQSGYELFDLEQGTMTTAEKHAATYAQKTGQLLARTEFTEETLAALEREGQRLREELAWEQERRELIAAVRKMLDENDMKGAKRALADHVHQDDCLAEEHYLYAFAVQKEDVWEAVEQYSKALEKGFSEFWVRYNRAVALIAAKRTEEAKDDLRIAHQIDQNHEGVLFYMRELHME